jgi:hypothetical protein
MDVPLQILFHETQFKVEFRIEVTDMAMGGKHVPHKEISLFGHHMID